jgi:predicted homoserine dehydrogenase-like protein
MNPQMFNSFLDGTKSAIEMAAIANACLLDVPGDGLLFPPCGVDDLPHVMRPRDKGGVLEKSGVVEVVSSLERDGRRCFATCAGASMSCWKRRTITPRIASGNMA